MLWFYEALFAATLFAGSGLFLKSASSQGLDPASFFFYMYVAGALTLTPCLLQIQASGFSMPALWSGMIIGTGMALGNHLLIRSLALGPISLTSPLVNLNTVFLVASAVLLYGETVTYATATLISLLVISVLILSIDKNEELRISSRSWFALVVLTSLFLAVRNGGLKVTDGMGLSSPIVLFYAYALSAIAYGCLKPRINPMEKHLLLLGGTAGLFSICGITLFARALSTGPASIVIPLFSTYNIFLVAIGCMVFRERLSTVQKLSIGIAIASSMALKLVVI